MTSFSQGDKDSYCIVTLRGSTVKNILNSYPSFKYFDFSFKQVNSKSYILTGYAYDGNDNKLGGLITLDSMAAKPRSLKNLSLGHLRLPLETMIERNVDGSENYVLTPKKCKKDGEMLDYVSYRFSNRVAKEENAFLSAKAVIEFDLNPSPPY
ncbi:hypothetical protein SAE01_39080 [Segetibacter aerophilus]|uniref:Uncharacterized protein n=2 Tax=Segetibacter aerophilus TaxID=670293 RepID=A0A512BHG8_9BACT|nr:hypothetical protein SAE01_39080 [Segetibacter aerophilus]